MSEDRGQFSYADKAILEQIRSHGFSTLECRIFFFNNTFFCNLLCFLSVEFSIHQSIKIIEKKKLKLKQFNDVCLSIVSMISLLFDVIEFITEIFFICFIDLHIFKSINKTNIKI